MFANHRARSAVGILMALLLLGAGRAEDKPANVKRGLAKLQGVWLRDGDVWIISGNEIRSYNPLGSSVSRIKFEIDPSKEPKQIDFVEGKRDRRSLAIYDVKGDTLKYCVAIRTRQGEFTARPTEFKAFEGVTKVFTLECAKTATGKAGEIRKTFLENEALAEKSYFLRVVKVTGPIIRIRKGDGGFEVLLGGKTTPLRFDFDVAERDRLAKLKAGEMVTIQGVCLGKGKSKGETGDEAILFAGSKIVEAKAEEPE